MKSLKFLDHFYFCNTKTIFNWYNFSHCVEVYIVKMVDGEIKALKCCLKRAKVRLQVPIVGFS